MHNRDVYVAIADPTRRQILELLRDRSPSKAGDIAGSFPEVSRPAISRHLRVLRECDVVTVQRHGKQQHYSLNTEPLTDLRDRWLARFTDHQVESLRRLRRIAEAPPSLSPGAAVEETQPRPSPPTPPTE